MCLCIDCVISVSSGIVAVGQGIHTMQELCPGNYDNIVAKTVKFIFLWPNTATTFYELWLLLHNDYILLMVEKIFLLYNGSLHVIF